MKKSIGALFYAIFCTSLLFVTTIRPVDYNDATTALKYAGAIYFNTWAAALGGKAINYTFNLEDFVENNRYLRITTKYRITSFANNVTNLPINCLKRLHSGRLLAAAVCGGLSYGCFRLASYIIQ